MPYEPVGAPAEPPHNVHLLYDAPVIVELQHLLGHAPVGENETYRCTAARVTNRDGHLAIMKLESLPKLQFQLLSDTTIERLRVAHDSNMEVCCV